MNKQASKTIEAADEYFMHTYNRYPLVLDRGEGVYLYDENGKKYLDFGAGIAVFALGYGNEKYNEAVKEQVDKLVHTSNYFYNKPSADACKKFATAAGMDLVFLTNSGTEAIEGAIKIARKYYFEKTGKAEGEIIAMNHSFHGRSMGALSVTGQPKYQEAFGPMLSNIKFADFNDIESVKSQITNKTAAILLETVQGEGGLYPASKEFLVELRKICDEKDILLMCDEIQCGMGRTGEMFAYQAYGVVPDVMTSAKALGCGIPVGAFAARGKAALALKPGDHGTTYGYNPLAGAAINAVLDIFEEDHIVDHVKEVSAYLIEKLDRLVEKYDCIKERRGMGLMQGVEFDHPINSYIVKAQEKGLIILGAGANIIRLVPPLTIEKEHVDQMIEILETMIA
ncbi:MAG: aspartate aminotransferase family protein [bacterium]|nr:aspartate aminotransferase family protein [bacterium]